MRCCAPDGSLTGDSPFRPASRQYGCCAGIAPQFEVGAGPSEGGPSRWRGPLLCQTGGSDARPLTRWSAAYFTVSSNTGWNPVQPPTLSAAPMYASSGSGSLPTAGTPPLAAGSSMKLPPANSL
jgi:hypothetical protein